MSHEVVFLPHILGQTWAEAVTAARVAAREEDQRIVAARLEPWPRLVLRAAEILGQIEAFSGRGQRELVHPVTRLRFTFFGEDGVIALPYWYDGPVARLAATMAYRFAHAVAEETGLSAYDPQLRMPLAEMGLEKFIAGYLRGREAALGQEAGRGAVPVGHALPPARSSGRRELGPGPKGGAAGRPGAGGTGMSRGAGEGAPAPSRLPARRDERPAQMEQHPRKQPPQSQRQPQAQAQSQKPAELPARPQGTRRELPPAPLRRPGRPGR